MGLAIQRTFFDDTLADWCPPEDFPELDGMIAIDIETFDPLIHSHGSSWVSRSGHEDKDGFMTGVAVAGPDWQAYYPTRHYGGNLDEERVLRWLKAQAAKSNINWVMFNRMYDEGWLKYRYDIPFTGKIFDPLTAAPLIDENRFSYSLDSLGKTYLKSTKDKGSLMEAAKMLGIANPWSVMHEFPAPFIGPYAEQDARMTWDLVAPFKKLMEDDDLEEIFNLESRLVPVLLEMRHRGCPVNTDKAEQVGKTFDKKHRDILEKIYQLTDHHIDIWNNRDIGKMLDSLGVHYDYTEKTHEPSITKGYLTHLTHPVGKMIMTARKYALAKGTFIDGHVLGHAINGVIHGQFHPLRKSDEHGRGGAVTGRFSSSNPNLQNLPARDEDNPLKDEVGEAVRGLFEPWQGENWAAIDYSGQEPRLATHFASLAKITGVETFVNAYRTNPRMKFHKKSQELTGLGYKEAKNMMLGKMYGMGGAKMCHDLNLPTEWRQRRGSNDAGNVIEIAGPEGQAIFDKFDSHMPWVKELADMAMRRAENRGWIRTLCGRRRRFNPIHPHGAFAYKALNCLIQGSAADQMKKAMVDLYESEGIVPLVTVHDELGISVADRLQAEHYAKLMVESVTLMIPNAVDLEFGPNWGAAK